MVAACCRRTLVSSARPAEFTKGGSPGHISRISKLAERIILKLAISVSGVEPFVAFAKPAGKDNIESSNRRTHTRSGIISEMGNFARHAASHRGRCSPSSADNDYPTKTAPFAPPPYISTPASSGYRLLSFTISAFNESCVQPRGFSTDRPIM
eukprot:SAG22_NODE_565_length_9046_cov_142.250475_3_plen_153_part_00